jgi:large-conductance mechanosensitive channel
MKKTFRIFKNKYTVKKSFDLAAIFTIIIISCFAILLKFGISKWRTYDTPISWGEFISMTPKLLIFGFIVFLIIFIFTLFLKDPKIVICINCLNTFYEANTKEKTCPECQSTLENLNGFYERHPNLRNKNKGKRKI